MFDIKNIVMLNAKKIAKTQLEIIMQIYKQHVIQNTADYISIDTLPNIPDRLKMLRALKGKYLVQYDESNKRCRLVTGDDFFKPYLSSYVKYEKVYDLFELAHAILVTKTKSFDNMTDEDKDLLEEVTRYINEKEFTGFGPIYLAILTSAIENNTLQFSRDMIRKKFGEEAFDKSGIVIKNDRPMLEMNFLTCTGVSKEFRITNAYKNIYTVTLDKALLEDNFFKKIISDFSTTDLIFTIAIKDISSIYSEMKKLATNPQAEKTHDLQFFKKSQLRADVFPSLAKTQEELMKQVASLTELVTESNDMMPIIDLLQKIQLAAGNSIKDIEEKQRRLES